MTLADVIAGVALLALIAYAVLGGADFGGGVWDLFASGPRREAQRAAIARAMGPVWEANHVWLIFVIVILFSAFPPAYAALSIALFTPFHLALVGITLRGAAFVFRSHLKGAPQAASQWGVVFGIASTITPLLLGACLGAIATGNVRVHGDEVVVVGLTPWLRPVSLAIGALALAVCAWLAAVFLVNETQGDLRRDFLVRARWCGLAVIALATVTLPLLRSETPHLWAGLGSARGAPVLALGVIAGAVSGLAGETGRHRLARAAGVVLVGLLLLGFWLAQYPHLVFPDLTIDVAAAPEPTLRFVAWSLPIGAALVLPSLGALVVVFKREALGPEQG